MNYKTVTNNDLKIQKEFLFLSMWLPDYEEPYTFDIMNEPFVKSYYKNWGKDGDFGLFLIIDDQPVAMAQLRKKSSLIVGIADLPELIISVKEEFQGQGLGKMLFKEILDNHAKKGLRLGVHPENKKAISLYEQFGLESLKLKDIEHIQMFIRK